MLEVQGGYNQCTCKKTQKNKNKKNNNNKKPQIFVRKIVYYFTKGKDLWNKTPEQKQDRGMGSCSGVTHSTDGCLYWCPCMRM